MFPYESASLNVTEFVSVSICIVAICTNLVLQHLIETKFNKVAQSEFILISGQLSCSGLPDRSGRNFRSISEMKSGVHQPMHR
jgi:hypothetical protein